MAGISAAVNHAGIIRDVGVSEGNGNLIGTKPSPTIILVLQRDALFREIVRINLLLKFCENMTRQKT